MPVVEQEWLKKKKILDESDFWQGYSFVASKYTHPASPNSKAQ